MTNLTPNPNPNQLQLDESREADDEVLRADYVICGGGSAGCVLAGRLSAAMEEDGSSVLVLEDGDGWPVPTAAMLSANPARVIHGDVCRRGTQTLDV